MALPIAIPQVGERPSLLETTSFDSFSSTSSSDKILFTNTPSRKSALTNKLSPHNAVPVADDEKSPTLILTRLPSIRNIASPRIASRPPSRSMTSTPDLSHSTTTSQSTTPLMLPEPSSAMEPPCFGLSPILGGILECSKRAEMIQALNPEDQFLIYLRDEAGVTQWDRVAEMMNEKGFPTVVKGLRTRYCTLKRDIDVSLREAIERLNSTQDEINSMLGSTNCRVRRLASCNKKKVGGALRVFEEEPAEEIDPAVWSEVVAKLRASGLR